VIVRRWVDDPATGYAVVGFGMGAFMSAVALLTGLLIRELPPAARSAQRCPSGRSTAACAGR
jgi:hypothetical protein